MVFGVFDGIHQGHKHFLKEAKKLGDKLIAVVASDEVVRTLKGRPPMKNVHERIEHVEKEDGVDEVIVGDDELGSWDIVKKVRPDVVAVGYDQKTLKNDLENSLGEFGWHLEIETISAHEPHKYRSSLLNGR